MGMPEPGKIRANEKSKMKIEIGQKFGRWTVLKTQTKRNAKRSWRHLCRCECGIEKDVSGQNLTRGESKSCGCLKKELWKITQQKIKEIIAKKHIEIQTGERFGNLTVLSKSEEKKKLQISYLCKCDCGARKVVGGANLRSSHVTSCGCKIGRKKTEIQKAESQKKYRKKATENLAANYVRKCLRRKYKVKKLPEELIQAKRMHLTAIRELKKRKGTQT